MVEKLLEHVDPLKTQNLSTLNNDDSEVTAVLAIIKAQSETPGAFLIPQHTPLGTYWGTLPFMLGCQVPQRTLDYNEIEIVLKREVKIRTGGAMMNIHPYLLKMDPETLQALHVLLEEVQRTRAVPGMTTDTYVWHDLADNICNILIAGITTDQSHSLDTFTKHMTFWFNNLAVTTAEDVDKEMKIREKKKEEEEEKEKNKSEDSDSDSEVHIILG